MDRIRGTKLLGRPPTPATRIGSIKAMLLAGRGIRAMARETGAGTATVQRIKQSLAEIENGPETVMAWGNPQAIMIVRGAPA